MSRRYWIVALLALSFGVGVFLNTLLYSDSWQHRERARIDLQKLKVENDAAENRLDNLRNQIDAMRDRPEAQERAVRYELGYVRAGEIVLELGEQE